MDKAGVRFSNSKYINFELDPDSKEVTITAVIEGAKLTGTITLTAAEAAKTAAKAAKTAAKAANMGDK